MVDGIEERKMAKVVEAKIVIPLKSSGIGEVSNIDKVRTPLATAAFRRAV